MIVSKTTQEQLLGALQSVAGVVERRHTLLVLANVMLKKEGDTLELTASDLEIQVRTRAQLGGDAGSLATTVAAKKLIDILRSLPPEQTVTLTSGQDKLVLQAGKSRYTLLTLPADDFPLVQQAADFGPAFSVPQKTLRQLIGQVHFAMAVNDIRYYLNGILFVAEGRTLTVVATDGHRLALAQATLDVEMPRQEVILPRKTVLELQRLLKDDKAEKAVTKPAVAKGDGDSAEREAAEGEAADAAAAEPVSTAVEPAQIQMRFAGNQARFEFNGIEFVTKLVEGKFPDFNRVIPKNHKNHLKLGRAPLLASLQRAAILTSDKFKGVRVNLEPGLLCISASNAEQEEAREELEIDYAGDPIEIGFNVTYLIDALSNMDTEMIQLDLQDSHSSALLTLPERSGFKYVVMPMRI